MNYVRTGMLLAALTVMLVAVGYLIAGPQGAFWAFLLALLVNAVSFWNADAIVLRMYRAQPLERGSAPRLYDIVEALARKAGLPMPRLYLVPSESPNAFATGRSPNHAAVAVTQGILRLLDDEELRGVLAHEVSHVRNRDMLTMTVAATLAGAIAMLATWARWAILLGGGRRRESRGGGLEVIGLLVVAVLAPLAAALVQLAVSRSREYGADESGARLAGSPYGLMSALGKLEERTRAFPMTTANPATAHLCIVNPLRADAMASLFRTHPSTADRIERLRRLLR